MDSARWDRIQSLFHDVADRAAAERRGVLEAACADDPTLVEDVLALLDEDGRPSLLDRDVASVARDVVAPPRPPSFDPGQFPPYRLRRPLGEGGMGVVYLAERTDLGSLVAIKILRDCWLSPARRQRFLTEQRTLAQLNHPGIARLYDAHTLDDGTPWFVMEYVDGVPLTEHCTSQQSSVADRLRLFRAVCEAVQYAHGHGVIHRDLKPSNILVKNDATVRLLDFGIAKHLDPLDTPEAHARTTMRLMTPAYASPEQVRDGAASVQSDVYSLGVILYELLTGRLPCDVSGIAASDAALLTTREAVRPSVAVRDRHKTGARVPAASTASWPDLDVLCLTAMHADPARRYQTVEAIVRDIDHFFRGEPLEARPDTLPYTTVKFVQRNWKLLTAGATTVSVVGGLAVMLGMSLNRSSAPATTTAVAPTVAVLPFRNVGSDPSLELDPSLVAAGGWLAILHTERGELASAYREAQDLVRRRPDSPDAHFALSDVLRFAGLMQEAERACGTAMSLDPHNWGWRSCVYDVLLACLVGKPESDIRALTAAAPIDTDPEVNYYSAAHLSYCGQTEASLRLLTRAVQGGYCSYPSMETDPFFARLRATAEFGRVRAAGIACQHAFLERRARLE